MYPICIQYIGNHIHENCEISAKNLLNDYTDTGDDTCLKCKEGMITIFNKSYSSYDKEKVSFTNHSQLPFGVFNQGFECMPEGDLDAYLTTNNTTPPENCEVFFELFPGHFGCKSCKFGYTGPFEDSGNQLCEIEIEDCDVDARLGGIFLEIDKNFEFHENMGSYTCHKCKSKDKIPVYFYPREFLPPTRRLIDD